MRWTKSFFHRGLCCWVLWAPVASYAAYPVFSGRDLTTGKDATVAVSAEKKALALVFLSAKCPCSASHEPVLTALAERFPDISFIGIHSNQNEETTQAESHFEKAKLPFAVLQDTGNRWADTYGAFKTPHLFLINSQGEVVYRGGVDDSRHAENASRHYLADALEAVESGRHPSVQETRTLGCVIPR